MTRKPITPGALDVELRKAIGARIRAARLASTHVTLDALAERIGVSHVAVWYWE